MFGNKANHIKAKCHYQDNHNYPENAHNEQYVIIHNIPDIAWLKDKELCYITVNEAFCQFALKPFEQICGQNDFSIWAEDTATKITASDKQIIESKQSAHYEWDFPGPNGKTSWLEINKSPIIDSEGNVTGIVGIARDISERKNNELELSKANENLTKAYEELAKQLEVRGQMERKLLHAQKMEAIGTLTGGIAHDFNNILWMIMGNSELLLYALIDQPDLLEIQQDIYTAADRAKGLVQQLLDFSRKKDNTNVQPIMLTPLVKEVGKMVRTMLPSTIELSMTTPSSEHLVLGDPSKIHQILMNLCTNAYHAMGEKGKLVIGLEEKYIDPYTMSEHSRLEARGGYFIIEVSDTGCGMSHEVMERIFDPFFTTKGVGQGTGLGLAMVHGIVTEMGGDIQVYSEVGQGTTFRIYLPIVENEKLNDEKTGSFNPEHNKASQHKKHILVADDEQMIRQMLTKMLHSLGYEVTTFENGEEALKAIEANPEAFDLIITDQTMPKFTGMELSKKVLALCPDKPIILATGYSKVITEEEMETINIRKLMNKPFQLQELSNAINEIFETQVP